MFKRSGHRLGPLFLFSCFPVANKTNKYSYLCATSEYYIQIHHE